MIPKIIHYCWFGGNPLNEMAKKCIESWKKYCPDYEVVEWNEANFDINCCQYVKEAYEAKKWAFVSDYARLYALYTCGGIYMDTDVELLKPLDNLLTHNSFSGFEDVSSIPTAIMGSEKNGEWVKYLLSYYEDKHFIKPDGSYDFTTNVIIITDMTQRKYNIALDNSFQVIKNTLCLYPKEYFCPKNYETGEIELTENAICIHHFNGSWQSKATEYLRNKRNKFIKKYGCDMGKEKFLEWSKRNKVFIYFMQHGIIKTYKKIIGTVLKKITRRLK